MKKTLLLGLFLIFALSGKIFSQVSMVEVWSHYGGTAPTWFTDGTEADISGNEFSGVERGIVYSDYSGHLYVSSRHGIDIDDDGILDNPEPHVFVLDPLTGNAPAFGVSSLLTTGINSNDADYGGGYPLNNVTTTPDGSIFACNMTLASGPDIVGEDGAITVKAFRVYRWDWEQGQAQMIIDYKESGYRLGDKFSVIGNWETNAYIYAGPGESNKLLRWTVDAGVVSSTPEVITLQDITSAGTSITVADVPSKTDWMYVSGKGFLPTLFTTAGVNLSQIAISSGSLTSSLLGGRTIEFGGSLYMALFSGDQSAFIINMTKQGENVTDADVIGYTPAFGTRFDNAYGEGAVEFGVIDNKLHVFVCAPSNGIACYRIDGIQANNLRTFSSDNFNLSVYPNPAKEFTNMSFTLPEDADGPISVKIYDLSGKFMGITVDKAKPGQQEIQVNTSYLSSGIYSYQLIYNNEVGTGKLIVE
jgi:hypothetical protein